MRYKIHIILLSFLILQGFLYVQNAQSIDNLIKEGNKKIENQEYSVALEKFEQVLEDEELNQYAISGKVKTLILMDNDRQALKFINDKLDNHQNNAVLHYNKGLVYKYRKRYKKAISSFEKALKSNNEVYKEETLLMRGVSYQNRQNYDASIEDFNTVISLNDSNINAYYNRGYSYYKLHDYRKAIKDFKQVISMDAENSNGYYNLGMSYFRLGETRTACRYFDKACKLNHREACKMMLTECTRSQ